MRDSLTSQYGASPHAVAAYRDTWRLLLGYAAQTTPTAPTQLDRQTVQTLKAFATEPPSHADGFVFPTRTGTRMSRDAVAPL